MAPLLGHRRFALRATSFVANRSYVEMIDSSGLRLTGGEVPPVSRALRTAVTKQWMDYCFERGRAP